MLAVALVVPMILWIVPRHGALGAAWVWIGLNTGYIVLNVGLMHRRLLAAEKWRWYGRDVLLPSLGAAMAMLLAYEFKPADTAGRGVWLAYLCGAYLGGAGCICADDPRLPPAHDRPLRLGSSDGQSMSEKAPLVSIGIPTYNREHLIARAIESAFHCIVVQASFYWTWR